MTGHGRSMIRDAAFALAGLFVLAGAALADEIELLMFEQPGCVYCAQWNAEIAPIYELAPEGQAAPLHRVLLSDSLPEGVEIDRPVTFTPTFVLTLDGIEQDRIEGYPGEHFFWPLLQRMIDGAEAQVEATEEEEA